MYVIYKCYPKNGVMTKNVSIRRNKIYTQIKVMSNQYRFKILELTQDNQISISELSSTLKLSYTKCTDYIGLLEKEGLIKKTKVGKEVLVSSKVRFKNKSVKFIV